MGKTVRTIKEDKQGNKVIQDGDGKASAVEVDGKTYVIRRTK